MKKILKYTVLLLVLLLIFVSCKKENKNPVPDVYVSFYLDISTTLYIELASVGGCVNLTGGYKGVVVYRASSDQFVAFERACPYDWESDSAYVDIEPSGLVLQCKKCKSEYLILDGSIVSGVAKYPLKQYKADFDGRTLHVYN